MEIPAKKEMTDMDEVFKEIRKRKALAEKFSADPNNSKEFRIYQGAYADALTFVLDELEFSEYSD